MDRRKRKVRRGVRSVCHRGVINTQWCWGKGGRADGASKHWEWNCKPKVPDTTCYYFWHKPFTIAMKVAMENVILIVCPQGFAPLTSKRHMSHICWVWWYVSPLLLLFFFILFCAPPPTHFHKSYFRGFVDSLFDEVITLLDWEGKVMFWESRK